MHFKFHWMKKTLIIGLLLLCLLPGALHSQSYYRTDFRNKNYVDTAAIMIWAGVNLGGQIPIGLLHDWFKPNLSVGVDLTFKTKSNWTFDIAMNYMFGGNLRDTSYAFLGSLYQNHIIYDGNGYAASGLSMEGRYWFFGAGVGKIIPVNRWKNSGIWIKMNMGYFGHKIRINDYDHQIPQFDGDYKKGYDHLSAGFAMNQFIGYLFIQKNRVLSFYGGIEFYEIWSKPSRNYIFNEGPTAGSKNKFSSLIGLRIGWNIPLYEKKSVTTFYTR